MRHPGTIETERKTDDPFVICSFKDRKSRRDLADSIVREHPAEFPTRSAVYLKAFDFLVNTLRIEVEQRKTTVDGSSARCDHRLSEGGGRINRVTTIKAENLE